MVLLSERLLTILDFDNKGAIRAMEQTAKSADRDLGKVESKADKAGAKLTKFGAASLAAAGVMAGALATTVGAASDLNEAINVNGLTFGDSAKEMEAWADTASTAIGQSKRSALEGAAAIGGLLQNVGFLEGESAELSRQLVTLASDMGSAFNMEPAEALAALRSGLAGESEPLKRFNVFINEAAVKTKAFELGLGDGTRALTDNEKAQARLAIIMEQTARIQGDFAATSDGAANAQRVFNAQLEDFKASVGQSVLPIFEGLLGHANDLLGAYQSLSPEQQEQISKMLVMGTAVVALGGGMSILVGRLVKVTSALRDMRGGLTAAQASTVLLTTAVVGGFAAWDAHKKRVEANKKLIEDFATAIEEADDKASGVRKGIEALADEHEDLRGIIATLSSGGVLDQVIADLDREGQISDETAEAMRDLGMSHTQVQLTSRILETGVQGATEKIAEMEQITRDTEGAVAGMGRVMDETTGALQRAAGWFDAAATSANTAGFETKFLVAEAQKAIEPFESMEDVLGRVNAALATYFGNIRSDFDLITDTEEAIDGLVESLDENGTTLETTSKEGLANRRAYSQLLGAIEDVTLATLDHTGSLSEAVAAGQGVIDSFATQATEAGLTEDAVKALVDQLSAVPAEVVSEVRVNDDGALAALQSIQGILDYVDGKTFTGNLGLLIPGGGVSVPQPRTSSPPAVADRFDEANRYGGAGGSSGGALSAAVYLDAIEVGRIVRSAENGMGGTQIVTTNVRGGG